MRDIEKLRTMLKIDIDKFVNKPVLGEGICYKPLDKCFEFDFNHDNVDDIIKLKPSGLKQSSRFSFKNLYFYKYEFEPDVDSSVRAKFIEYLKKCQLSEKDMKLFINAAVGCLNDYIDLWTYDTVIYPESMSEINRKIIADLKDFGASSFTSYELVKIPLDKAAFKSLKSSNILLVDDVATSGQTIVNLIHVIKKVNPKATVVVFTLLGK